MKKIALAVFDEKLSQIWDAVVRSSKNGNFLHLRDYISYHAHRFDEHSLIVLKNGKPIAVFPCNRTDDHVVSHGGLTYGGLIYGTELGAAEVLEVMEEVASLYRSNGFRRILYKAIPHIFHRYPADEDLYALHRLGAHLVRRDLSSAVQLNNRPKLSDSRKNTIRKGLKNGVVIRETDGLFEFHPLVTSALALHGAKPIHTLAELELLKGRFPSQIRLFGAYVSGTMIAGALIYDFGPVVHTQYLASSPEGRSIGALDFLLAHFLDDIFATRQFFSFGISTEDQGRYLNEGLLFQKESFGGRAVIHDFYELEL